MSSSKQEIGMQEENKVEPDEEMKEYITEVFKDTKYNEQTVTVIAVLSGWGLEMLENPENEQEIVAALKKPWKEQSFLDYDISPQEAKSVFIAASPIAMSLVSFSRNKRRKIASRGYSEIFGEIITTSQNLAASHVRSAMSIVGRLVDVSPSMVQTPLEMDFSFAAADPEIGSCFDVEYLHYAGIEHEDQSRKRLYCREETVTLLNALQSMEKGLRIVGPPGVGKSCTVWFWVCKQVLLGGKSALWIHFTSVVGTRFLLLSKDVFFNLSFANEDEESDFTRNCDADIVVIDGMTGLPEHRRMSVSMFTFRNPKRQAISVASQAVKTNDEDDFYMDITSHQSYPWRFEEYLSAIKDSTFFKNVRPFLDNESSENSSFELEEIMRKKFYYAGCSARWMFASTLDTVCNEILKYFRSVDDYIALLRGSVRAGSQKSVNHLTCFYSIRQKFFVSEYIARQALYRGGSEAVRLAYGISKSLQNPSFTGWVVEMDFVQQIINAKPDDIVIEDETWEAKEVMELETDLESLTIHAGNLNHGTWLLPLKWNQGGYDLVCLLKIHGEYLLRFVKVTNSDTLSLKLKHFRNLADAMSSVLGRGVRVERIEIVMMVPTEVQDFTIIPSQVKDSGILQSFKVGNSENMWQKNHEHTLVRTLHFNKTT